jgi:hypothetical protein
MTSLFFEGLMLLVFPDGYTTDIYMSLSMESISQRILWLEY